MCALNNLLVWKGGLGSHNLVCHYKLTLCSKAVVLGGWQDSDDNPSFSIHRCSLSKELPSDLQEDTLPAFSGVCSRLHPSLWPHHPYGGWGSRQYLLQAFLLLCDRAQPHRPQRTRAFGKCGIWGKALGSFPPPFTESFPHLLQWVPLGSKVHDWIPAI